ncbi:MAG: hypothetical protein DSZ23_04585 [Thermodesulfatator sp.]|nr:MAG: hypothetical protein DSZ23_04585 [Thermodesulfatator sp.]
MKYSENLQRFMFFLVICLSMLLAYGPPGFCGEQSNAKTDSKGKSLVINFDQSSTLPAGFRVETTGRSLHDAVWKVVECQQAPSRPNVLRITRIKSPSGSQFNICWTDRVRFRDGDIEVKVRADSGRIDQGGGPIWRVKDKSNYYVARLNPLEDNFRIYYVKNGRRIMIGTASVRGIREGQWFTIKIRVNGDMITGWVNGKKMIEVKDSTLKDEGGVGMWSKADAASSFDDLVINTSD